LIDDGQVNRRANENHRERMTKSRLQFTLSHALIAVTLIGAFFGSIAWAGLLGVVLFGGACGIALLCLALFTRDGRYAVPGGLLALLSAGTLVAGSTVAVGSGHSTLPCTVRVIDASGNPVGSACVRIRDVSLHGQPEGVPVHPVPAGEPGVSGVTNAKGTVALAFEFPNTSRWGLFVDETHVYISPYVWVQVEAPGYEREMIRLDTVTGTSYDWYELPLPQTKVQLTRAAQQ
jgi:hypothetical protein